MNEWINKKCKVFIKNLSPNGPIVYTGTIKSIDESFITFLDRDNNIITINKTDITMIKGVDER